MFNIQLCRQILRQQVGLIVVGYQKTMVNIRSEFSQFGLPAHKEAWSATGEIHQLSKQPGDLLSLETVCFLYLSQVV